jgi:hypothetical protein
LYLRPSESRGVKKPKLNRKFFVGSAVKWSVFSSSEN